MEYGLKIMVCRENLMAVRVGCFDAERKSVGFYFDDVNTGRGQEINEGSGKN